MEEDRAAFAGNDRIVIIPYLRDHIIKPVVPPERLVPARAGKGHESVVNRLARIITPPVGRFECDYPQTGLRRWSLVRPVVDVPKRPGANWRGPIAFVLVSGRLQATFSEGAAEDPPFAFKTPVRKGGKVTCQCGLPGLLLARDYAPDYAAR
jgi:hypothetical protein